MCARTWVSLSPGATGPDKSPLTLSCLTAPTVFAQWINHSLSHTCTHLLQTHTHTHTQNQLQWPQQHPSPVYQGITYKHACVCVCLWGSAYKLERLYTCAVACWGRPTPYRPSPLCILTLWWQVLLQETMKLLQIWQPAHHRDTHTNTHKLGNCEQTQKETFWI